MYCTTNSPDTAPTIPYCVPTLHHSVTNLLTHTRTRTDLHVLTMEIDGLGRRCSLPNCRRLDYLPISCAHCKQSFCDEHHKPQAHTCIAIPNGTISHTTAVTTVNDECPQCGAPLKGITLGEHLKTCVVRKFRVDPRCILCNKRDPLAVKCPECANLYCVEHRLPEVHQCAALGTGGGGGSQKTSSLRKMKLKFPKPSRKFANTPQQPIGDTRIEAEDRITCTVHFAITTATTQLPPRYMYFSVKWSAGKIIDDINKRVQNLPKPQQGNRFVLYAVKATHGVNLLPHVTPIRDLPKSTLSSGDALVLADDPNGLPQEWINALTATSSSSLGRRQSRRQSNSSKCCIC